jgi:hypothetical protein
MHARSTDTIMPGPVSVLTARQVLARVRRKAWRATPPRNPVRAACRRRAHFGRAPRDRRRVDRFTGIRALMGSITTALSPTICTRSLCSGCSCASMKRAGASRNQKPKPSLNITRPSSWAVASVASYLPGSRTPSSVLGLRPLTSVRTLTCWPSQLAWPRLPRQRSCVDDPLGPGSWPPQTWQGSSRRRRHPGRQSRNRTPVWASVRECPLTGRYRCSSEARAHRSPAPRLLW